MDELRETSDSDARRRDDVPVDEQDVDVPDDVPEAMPSPEQVRELREKAAERDEFLDRMQRMKAESRNFKNRLVKDYEANKLYAVQRLVAELLPVIDNLDRAIESAREDGGGEAAQALLDGVELVRKQTLKVLEDEGVAAINAVGEPFDPAEHEALVQMPSEEHAKGIVIAEHVKGYRLKDRVVRPSKVVISSGPATTPEAGAASDGGPERDEQRQE